MSNSLLNTTAVQHLSVSNYKVVELIGTGGMANIYKAVQLSLDRLVALKIMHPHLTMDEGFVARFEKEAKQAAQLQHENIVSIIDYGSENGVYYIAMEHIDGKNLRQILEKQRRLPLEICLLICHQVAEGLKYAHSHNLVHRDIKPANIILSSDGRVLITDFGIAKGNDDLSITATGQMIGSPAYMSPEQAAGKHTDHRSDLFSLGIILYEVIAGEKPFRGESYQAMVASIMSARPEPMQKLRVDVNPELEELVAKSLVKDVDSRYQNAEDFADSLYTQLQRFKIPPVKKLISSFLKNPIKVTEKLRTEKISNHMESALYFLTMGEGRLKEARKEFQEVLRFDKNNKSARDYLAKLQSQSPPGKKSASPQTYIKLKQWHLAVGGGIILALILILLFSSGKDTAEKSTDSSKTSEQISTPVENNTVDANNDKTSGADSDNKNSAEDTKTTDDIGTEDSSAKKDNKTTNDNAVDKKKTETTTKKTTKTNNTTTKKSDKKNSDFNYPNQEIGEYGMVAAKTNVPAEIYIDLTRYGKTNGPPIKLAPGRHFVEIKADGYRRMTRRIFTENGKTINMEIDMISDR